MVNTARLLLKLLTNSPEKSRKTDAARYSHHKRPIICALDIGPGPLRGIFSQSFIYVRLIRRNTCAQYRGFQDCDGTPCTPVAVNIDSCAVVMRSVLFFGIQNHYMVGRSSRWWVYECRHWTILSSEIHVRLEDMRSMTRTRVSRLP